MKIISWNVNSIRARINQITDLLEEEEPDFLCLQETKILDDQFPRNIFSNLGYSSYFCGIPSYNGVAILSKNEVENISKANLCNKNDARYISAKAGKFEIISVYVPAGGDDPDPKTNPKFEHKLLFLMELNTLLKNKKNLIVCGDLNVAPYEDDVWSHQNLKNVVSHTEIERTKLIQLLDECKLTDAIRCFLNPPKNIFTWWSYRSPNFEKNNRGRRLDHILISTSLKNQLVGSKILKKFRKKERPSDHAPICLELDS